MSRKKASPKICNHSHEPLRFPKGFLWGAATSAHQVEGDNIHNDWWAWEQRKGTIENGERSGKAAGHYQTFEADFDIAKNLYQNAHRLSIEWSRIEPEEGKWDWSEVEHYRKVLRALKKRKLKTMVTLHHFTNPVWFAKQGGWEQPASPRLFARYAEFIAEHLGEYVDFWVTINEPVIFTTMGYVVAQWPPQHKSLFRAARVFFHLAKAHRLAYREIHAEMKKQHQQAQVGIAQNVISVASYRKKLLDYAYMRATEFVWNDLFFSCTKRKHDFIGINYYFHQRLERGKGRKFFFVDVRREHREHSDMGWEVFAPGLFEALIHFQEYKLPIYITENGIAAVNDDKRSRFIVAHVKELYHAIQAGVDVRGYFHWSLLDNFEWDKGFFPRFGLVEVQYPTLKRRIRPSANVYARIAKENAIEHELLRFIGHGVVEEHPVAYRK